MSDVIVLIPVYKEIDWIKASFAAQWAFLHGLSEPLLAKVVFRFCVWAPTPNTPLVEALQNALKTWPTGVRLEVVSGCTGEPSVVASLRLGFDPTAPRAYFLLCPIDCSPGLQGLHEAVAFAQRKSTRRWALFPKKYDRGGLMCLSALFQNAFVLPVLGAACWTNLFLVPSEAFDAHFARGTFLEDIRANESLRKSLGNPYRFKSKALVSARRYANRGPLRQMATNVFIFVRYLLGRFDESTLRRVHEGRAFVSETPKSPV